jgi:hypothetical protein
MPDINSLRQYLDLYDREMGGAQSYRGAPSPWITGHAQQQMDQAGSANALSERMAWAERMAGGGGGGGQSKMPDFFGGQQTGYSPGAYREPATYDGAPPMRARGNPQVQNFLAQLLKMGPR